MDMYLTDEQEIRVHFRGLVSSLEQLRTSRRSDISPKTYAEIRKIELKLDEIEDLLLSLQF